VVQKKIKSIVWSQNATDQYYEVLEYLSKEAPEAIEIVANALLDLIESLSTEYNNHPLDRFKMKNDGTYKAAIVFSFRISYQIGEKHLRIIRIRHASREPLTY
jgi:plasmid stabilization system protein ParE